MTKKLSLNVQGFHALQDQLFNLSDPALAVEISLLRANPKIWVERKFDLSAAERSALKALSPQCVGYLAIRLSNRFALRKRLQFTVIDVHSFLENKHKNILP